VDGGGSEGSATINHNTLLIDDGGEVMNYPPNQGVWGEGVKTTRFGDDGVAVVAVGEIGEAYAPTCAIKGCKKRSVERLTRSFVFVRPALLVIDDDVALDSPDTGVTWAAHLTQPPKMDGDTARAVIGASRVDVVTLEPRGAAHRAPREPTPSGEGSHRLNQPWGPMWRLEVDSSRGEKKRHFLHAILASAAADPEPSVQRTEEGAVRGVLVRGAGMRAAVLFAGDGATFKLKLPGPADTVLVAGLDPGKRYRLEVEPTSCTVSLGLSRAGSDLVATSGGFLRTNAPCKAP
jgi:hypothetical protein